MQLKTAGKKHTKRERGETLNGGSDICRCFLQICMAAVSLPLSCFLLPLYPFPFPLPSSPFALPFLSPFL